MVKGSPEKFENLYQFLYDHFFKFMIGFYCLYFISIIYLKNTYLNIFLVLPTIFSASLFGIKSALNNILINIMLVFSVFKYLDESIFFQIHNSILFILFVVFVNITCGLLVAVLADSLRFKHKKVIKLNEYLRETQNKFEFLFNTIKITSSILNPVELCNKLVELINVSYGYPSITIFLKDDKTNQLELIALRNFQNLEPGFKVKIGQGITGKAAEIGETIMVADVTKDSRYIPGLIGAKSELAVPIKHKGNVIGVLNIESTKPGDFSSDEIESLEIFADQIAIAIDNARLMERTKKQAITDGLTGLYNYSYFMDKLKHEFNIAERYNTFLSVILIDLDDFKWINDTFGHPSGDLVLKQVSLLIKNTVRKSDIVARYGGEEFIIILPNTDKKGALSVAEKIRQKIELQPFSDEQKSKTTINITASLGVSTYPDDANNWDELVNNVDKLLYMAKRGGKNCVCNHSH